MSRLEGIQDEIDSANQRSSQVGKAGLAPQRGCPAGDPALPPLAEVAFNQG